MIKKYDKFKVDVLIPRAAAWSEWTSDFLASEGETKDSVIRHIYRYWSHKRFKGYQFGVCGRVFDKGIGKHLLWELIDIIRI